MADMQQLERAFMKAHKAGDTKAAAVIAAEIKRQRAAVQAPTGEVSGLMDQFWSGVDQPLEDMGVSVQEAGKAIGSPTMAGAGQSMRDFTQKPDNFVSAGGRFMNPQQGDSYVDPVLGFGWGNLPGAVAEQTGGLAGNIAARSAGGLAGSAAGPGGAAVGAFAGPALFNFIRQVGPNARELADKRGHPEPTWEDWTQAAATAGVSGALESIGVGKIGVLNEGVKQVAKKTATSVVTGAVKETGKKALKEGATEAAQSVVDQYGTSVGTPGGAQVDLKQAVGEGIIGAGTGGAVDATVNAYPTIRTANDIRAVDNQYRNNPDAQMQAEVTAKVNGIADRMKGSGKDPLSREINDSVKNFKNQVVEAIKGQNLSTDDKTALRKGLDAANGMDSADMDAIAGRSENPDEMRALIRKVQVIREMTMQQQSAKGLRGALADLAYHGGAPLGGAIGAAVTGGVGGTAAGSYIGDRIGTSISRRMKGNQTQGNAIDSLIGKAQARRAKLLLDRYGPSQATEALNTLTEKAAVNKAQKEKAAQEAKDWQATLDQMKFASDMRKNAREQWENAPPGQAKAKAKAKLDETNLKTREERLKALANRAVQSKIRTESMVNKLEAEKSINALRVEKAQIEKDLAEATAKDTATASKAKADSKVLDLQGKLLKLVDDIKLREEAIAKAKAVTKRAEKIAARVPEATTAAEAMARKSAREYAKMTSKQIAAVKTDQFGNPILDGANYQQQAERIAKLESDGLAEAAALPDKELGNTFIRAIRDFQTYRGRKNQAKRMAIYETVINEVSQTDLDAMRFVMLYIRPLAFAFDSETSMSGSGTADFGTTNGPGEDPPF